MIYGYARCSTNESKQDVDRQRRELKSMGATDETIYYEYMSGTKVDRVELNKLLNIVTQGDTIVVTELSRITRSTRHLCDIIELVQVKKIKIIIQNSITLDCSTNELDGMTKAFLQIAGVFAELEREMICNRVKSGIANAKAKAAAEGREYRASKKTTVEDIPVKFKMFYEKYQKNEFNLSELARIADISRVTAYKYVRLLE